MHPSFFTNSSPEIHNFNTNRRYIVLVFEGDKKHHAFYGSSVERR